MEIFPILSFLICNLSFGQKIEVIKKLRGRGWAQEKVARVIGLVRSRVSEIEKNGSDVDIDNAAIPDLRYKISKEAEDEIFERAETETQEQIASDHNITRQRVAEVVGMWLKGKAIEERLGQTGGGSSAT